MTDLSENCELQTLINLTTYAPLLDAWHQLKKTADPKEAEVLLAKIDRYVFEAELRGQPLFRNGAGEAWHLSLTNLKAEYGLRKMVGVPALARTVAAVMVGPDLLSRRVLFPGFRDINKQPPSAESRQAPRSIFATWRSHVNVCGVLYLMRINDAHTAKIACVAPLYVVLPLGEHFLDHVLNPADS